MSYAVKEDLAVENASSRRFGFCLSQEKVLKTLESLGLTQPNAQIYVFLGKKGPQKAKDIAKSLRVPKQTLYRAIKSLESKGLIAATLEYPARFSAVPFERVLDLFVKAKTEEVHRIEEDKKDLLLDWQSIAIAEVGDQSPKFTVLEGRNYIYPRLKQMIEDTKSQLSIIFTVSGLMRADQFGLLDAAFNHASKTNTKFKFLTELSDGNLKAMKLLLERMPKGSSFEGRTPELGLRLISRMLIRDDAEAAFFVSQEVDKTARDADDLCLWTNSRNIVDSFRTLFEDLWQNSANLEEKIAEIETGKPSPKTFVISDAETAHAKYQGILRSAKEEIIIMTSSEGLVELQREIGLLNEWVGRRVSVRIMAPIINENLLTVHELSNFCKVRHLPLGYPETTIVDGKHLFTFKKQYPNKEKPQGIPFFGSTFYTNDPDYVEKTKSMLDDIWNNAVSPSDVPLNSIINSPMPAVAPSSNDEYVLSRADSPYKKMTHGIESKVGIVTEKDVLSKIISAKKYPGKNWPKEIARYYGCHAAAVIHPPDYLKLPDLIFWVLHYDKQSSFGAEDLLMVYLWLETPQGYSYVLVAFVTDNPRSVKFWKEVFAGTPAGQNVQLIKRDEFQVRAHGNMFFAGWAVPIQLLPPKFVLPPACILLEGYSKIKSGIAGYVLPSGVRLSAEYNGLDSFVTFFHPLSKYAGPGTDGIMSRDLVTTIYPPSAK